MTKNIKILILLMGCSIGFMSCSPEKKTERSPNIIYFLADDLGYGELGVYGQSIIKTPHIDALAKNGMRFTQHYSGAPVCAPARYMFLTGKHAGHAYIRGNDEWNERGDVWNYNEVYLNPGLEGQRPIPKNTITLGDQLKKAGYTTSIFGKWGLGAPESDGIPTLQGFDFFYGYNCQRQAHNLYPAHLWENETKVLLNNQLVPPRTKLDTLADPSKEESYIKFTQNDYAPQKIQEKAKDIILNGVKVNNVKYGKGTRQVNNLLKSSDTEIIHIRPHAKNSKDIDKPYFEFSKINISWQSFWLNKSFTEKIINKK